MLLRLGLDLRVGLVLVLLVEAWTPRLLEQALVPPQVLVLQQELPAPLLGAERLQLLHRWQVHREVVHLLSLQAHPKAHLVVPQLRQAWVLHPLEQRVRRLEGLLEDPLQEQWLRLQLLLVWPLLVDRKQVFNDP